MKTSQVSGPSRAPESGKTQVATPRRNEGAHGSRFGRLLDGTSPMRREARDLGAPIARGREGEADGLSAARARLMVDRDEDGRGSGFGRGHGGSESRGESDRDLLAPFAPPPPALVAPPSSSAPATPVAGSAAERAEVAALVDRLVTSMRVGRVGRDGHEVHLRLGSGIDVRLRHEHGELRAELRTEGGRRDEAERIARALEQEMSARGVTFAALEVS